MVGDVGSDGRIDLALAVGPSTYRLCVQVHID